MVTVAEESAPPARRRATLKYVITQNSAMNRYPPIRCSASIRELALAALTRDHDSSTSQTFTPPSRTNARPRAILAEGVNMLNLLNCCGCESCSRYPIPISGASYSQTDTSLASGERRHSPRSVLG